MKTRKSAEWLAERMVRRGHDVTVLHGEMTIEDRAKTIEQFKDSVYKVLITTNVCARGIFFFLHIYIIYSLI